MRDCNFTDKVNLNLPTTDFRGTTLKPSFKWTVRKWIGNFGNAREFAPGWFWSGSVTGFMLPCTYFRQQIKASAHEEIILGVGVELCFNLHVIIVCSLALYYKVLNLKFSEKRT